MKKTGNKILEDCEISRADSLKTCECCENNSSNKNLENNLIFLGQISISLTFASVGKFVKGPEKSQIRLRKFDHSQTPLRGSRPLLRYFVTVKCTCTLCFCLFCVRCFQRLQCCVNNTPGLGWHICKLAQKEHVETFSHQGQREKIPSRWKKPPFVFLRWSFAPRKKAKHKVSTPMGVGFG